MLYELESGAAATRAGTEELAVVVRLSVCLSRCLLFVVCCFSVLAFDPCCVAYSFFISPYFVFVLYVRLCVCVRSFQSPSTGDVNLSLTTALRDLMGQLEISSKPVAPYDFFRVCFLSLCCLFVGATSAFVRLCFIYRAIICERRL